MSNLPKDPVMLLSFVNMQLRDHYANLSDFCKAFGVEEDDITNKLETIDYKYESSTNQFV